MTKSTLGLLFLALSIGACGKKDEAGKEPAGKTSEKKTEEARKEVAPKLNETLVDHVKKLVDNCTVSVEQAQAYSCKNDVSQKLRDYVLKEKPSDFYSTLVQLVLGDDEKQSAVAITVIDEYSSYLGPEELKKQAGSRFTVDKMLEAFKKQKGNRATRLAQDTTHLATIAGRADELYAIVDKHEKNARNKAYSYFMTYGRSKALPKLKEVAKDKDFAASALQAPRNMFKATDDEKAGYCPWAEGYLGDEDASVATSAGYTVVNCKGKYIESLIAEAQKRVEAGKFKNPFAMVMREPCFEFMSGVSGKAGEPEQCEKVYAFLEKTANDKRVDDETRGMALWNIYYQRRTQKTLDLMRKYENSPVKAIAERAKDAIKSLTTTYKLK